MKQLPKAGDIVLFEGNKYKVDVIGHTDHPELYGGRANAKPGWFVMLEPVEDGVEEVGGWVNIRRLKRIKGGN